MKMKYFNLVVPCEPEQHKVETLQKLNMSNVYIDCLRNNLNNMECVEEQHHRLIIKIMHIDV